MNYIAKKESRHLDLPFVEVSEWHPTVQYFWFTEFNVSHPLLGMKFKVAFTLFPFVDSVQGFLNFWARVPLSELDVLAGNPKALLLTELNIQLPGTGGGCLSQDERSYMCACWPFGLLCCNRAFLRIVVCRSWPTFLFGVKIFHFDWINLMFPVPLGVHVSQFQKPWINDHIEGKTQPEPLSCRWQVWVDESQSSKPFYPIV